MLGAEVSYRANAQKATGCTPLWKPWLASVKVLTVDLGISCAKKWLCFKAWTWM
jgi:hypothetical protein